MNPRPVGVGLGTKPRFDNRAREFYNRAVVWSPEYSLAANESHRG